MLKASHGWPSGGSSCRSRWRRPEYGGTPWENPEGYERFNPVLHVDKWKTPMMVVQGDLDFRIPTVQGLSTFTALQRRGIESRLLPAPEGDFLAGVAQAP